MSLIYCSQGDCCDEMQRSFDTEDPYKEDAGVARLDVTCFLLGT